MKKNCIKSDFKEIFLKLVANDRSDKMFLLTSKFCPLGLSAPDLRLYMFIKSWKDVYEVRGWRFFLNLQQMTIVMRPSCWHQNFGTNGLSAPTLGLCLNLFSAITADFNISSALRWAIQDHWSSGLVFLQAKHFFYECAANFKFSYSQGYSSQLREAWRITIC